MKITGVEFSGIRGVEYYKQKFNSDIVLFNYEDEELQYILESIISWFLFRYMPPPVELLLGKDAYLKIDFEDNGRKYNYLVRFGDDFCTFSCGDFVKSGEMADKLYEEFCAYDDFFYFEHLSFHNENGMRFVLDRIYDGIFSQLDKAFYVRKGYPTPKVYKLLKNFCKNFVPIKINEEYNFVLLRKYAFSNFVFALEKIENESNVNTDDKIKEIDEKTIALCNTLSYIESAKFISLLAINDNANEYAYAPLLIEDYLQYLDLESALPIIKKQLKTTSRQTFIFENDKQIANRLSKIFGSDVQVIR